MKIINTLMDSPTKVSVFMNLETTEKQLHFLTRQFAKDPKESGGSNYYYRGLSRYALNQFEEAIANYDRVTNLYSDSTEVYVNRSLARIALEDYKTAIRDCDKAIGINPHSPDAFEVRGTAKIKLGDTIAGNEDIDKARQLRARWRVRVPSPSYKNASLRSSESYEN